MSTYFLEQKETDNFIVKLERNDPTLWSDYEIVDKNSGKTYSFEFLDYNEKTQDITDDFLAIYFEEADFDVPEEYQSDGYKKIIGMTNEEIEQALDDKIKGILEMSEAERENLGIVSFYCSEKDYENDL